MSWLLDLDRDIFIFINSKMTTPLLDVVMPVATELHKHYEFWIFIALFFAVLILRPTTGAASGPELGSESGAGVTRKSRARAWLTGVLLVGLSMGLADLAAYRGVKVWVKRDRPEAAGVPVVLRTDSHSGWSFSLKPCREQFCDGARHTNRCTCVGYSRLRVCGGRWILKNLCWCSLPARRNRGRSYWAFVRDTRRRRV